jgi:hypothetical protein
MSNFSVLFLVSFIGMIILSIFAIIRNLSKAKQFRLDREKMISDLVSSGFRLITEDSRQMDKLGDIIRKVDSGFIPISSMNIRTALKKEMEDRVVYISDISRVMESQTSGRGSSSSRNDNINILTTIDFPINGVIYIRPRLSGIFEGLINLVLPLKPVSTKLGTEFDKLYLVYITGMSNEAGLKIISNNVSSILLRYPPKLTNTGDSFLYRTLGIGNGAISIMESQDWREESIRELLNISDEISRAVMSNLQYISRSDFDGSFSQKTGTDDNDEIVRFDI